MIPSHTNPLGAGYTRLPYLEVHTARTHYLPTDILPRVGDVLECVFSIPEHPRGITLVPYGCRSGYGASDSWGIMITSTDTLDVYPRFGTLATLVAGTVGYFGTVYHTRFDSATKQFTLNGSTVKLNTTIADAVRPLRMGSMNSGNLEYWPLPLRIHLFTYNGMRFVPIRTSNGVKGLLNHTNGIFYPMLHAATS